MNGVDALRYQEAYHQLVIGINDLRSERIIRSKEREELLSILENARNGKIRMSELTNMECILLFESLGVNNASSCLRNDITGNDLVFFKSIDDLKYAGFGKLPGYLLFELLEKLTSIQYVGAVPKEMISSKEDDSHKNKNCNNNRSVDNASIAEDLKKECLMLSEKLNEKSGQLEATIASCNKKESEWNLEKQSLMSKIKELQDLQYNLNAKMAAMHTNTTILPTENFKRLPEDEVNATFSFGQW